MSEHARPFALHLQRFCAIDATENIKIDLL